MAKAVQWRGRKGAAPTTAKRKAAQPNVTPDKIRALVYNLSTPELDELIKVATGGRMKNLRMQKPASSTR